MVRGDDLLLNEQIMCVNVYQDLLSTYKYYLARIYHGPHYNPANKISHEGWIISNAKFLAVP